MMRYPKNYSRHLSTPTGTACTTVWPSLKSTKVGLGYQPLMGLQFGNDPSNTLPVLIAALQVRKQ